MKVTSNPITTNSSNGPQQQPSYQSRRPGSSSMQKSVGRYGVVKPRTSVLVATTQSRAAKQSVTVKTTTAQKEKHFNSIYEKCKDKKALMASEKSQNAAGTTTTTSKQLAGASKAARQPLVKNDENAAVVTKQGTIFVSVKSVDDDGTDKSLQFTGRPKTPTIAVTKQGAVDRNSSQSVQRRIKKEFGVELQLNTNQLVSSSHHSSIVRDFKTIPTSNFGDDKPQKVYGDENHETSLNVSFPRQPKQVSQRSGRTSVASGTRQTRKRPTVASKQSSTIPTSTYCTVTMKQVGVDDLPLQSSFKDERLNAAIASSRNKSSGKLTSSASTTVMQRKPQWNTSAKAISGITPQQKRPGTAAGKTASVIPAPTTRCSGEASEERQQQVRSRSRLYMGTFSSTNKKRAVQTPSIIDSRKQRPTNTRYDVAVASSEKQIVSVEVQVPAILQQHQSRPKTSQGVSSSSGSNNQLAAKSSHDRKTSFNQQQLRPQTATQKASVPSKKTKTSEAAATVAPRSKENLPSKDIQHSTVKRSPLKREITTVKKEQSGKEERQQPSTTALYSQQDLPTPQQFCPPQMNNLMLERINLEKAFIQQSMNSIQLQQRQQLAQQQALLAIKQQQQMQSQNSQYQNQHQNQHQQQLMDVSPARVIAGMNGVVFAPERLDTFQDNLYSHRSNTNTMVSPQPSLLSMTLPQQQLQAVLSQVNQQMQSQIPQIEKEEEEQHTFEEPAVEESVFEEPRSYQKLGALIQGYKTRRILKSHQIVSQHKKDYSDLLHFAFGLQMELRSLNQSEQADQVRSVKQLLVQSVKDLNHKRMQFNECFYHVFEGGAKWHEQSREKNLAETLATRKSFEGFKPSIKSRSTYQVRSQSNNNHLQQTMTSSANRRTIKRENEDIMDISVAQINSTSCIESLQTEMSASRQSKSVEPKVRYGNFLKKGQKSKLYDPKEAIKNQKKLTAENKQITADAIQSSNQSMPPNQQRNPTAQQVVSNQHQHQQQAQPGEQQATAPPQQSRNTFMQSSQQKLSMTSPATRANVLTKAVQSCQISLTTTSPFANQHHQPQPQHHQPQPQQQLKQQRKVDEPDNKMKTPDQIRAESPKSIHRTPSSRNQSSLFRKQKQPLLKQQQQQQEEELVAAAADKSESSRVESMGGGGGNNTSSNYCTEGLKMRQEMSFANGTFGEKESSNNGGGNLNDTSYSQSILSGDTTKRSKHQIMGQINDKKTHETLAAINEMLLITQNYLLQRPGLFECEESSATGASIEELKQSLAARVNKLDLAKAEDDEIAHSGNGPLQQQ